MSGPKEWWIIEGDHGSWMGTQEFVDHDGNLLAAHEESWDDGFYSCVSRHKFKDGINVIEKSAYDALKAENELMGELLSWFVHYVSDKQYEQIPIDKDFDLREALAKAKALLTK